MVQVFNCESSKRAGEKRLPARPKAELLEVKYRRMIWQLLLMACALGAAYYRWSRRRLYKLAAEIPGLPDSYPVIGHAHIFAGSNEDIMQALQKIGRISNQHDGLTSFWLANRLCVGMTDPAAIEVVSKSCLDKDEYIMKILQTVTGNGSVFAPVNIWHPRRKINAAFFSRKNLNQLVPVFDAKSSIMADLLRAEAGGGDFPIWRYITTFTADTVCGKESFVHSFKIPI
ncbi:cytochrome P450 4C1-like [Cydia amplana]|uniref:cytochrome P450 4C1-like n=1 Tax=Cydia amplana TaxID=1869771 RepID=UPI002FE54D2E